LCNLKGKDAFGVVMSHRSEVGVQAVKKKGRERCVRKELWMKTNIEPTMPSVLSSVYIK